MEGSRVLPSLAVCCLIASTALATTWLSASFALENTMSTGIVILASCGATIAALSSFLRQRDDIAVVLLDRSRAMSWNKYEAVPLHEVGLPHASREPSPHRSKDLDTRYPSSLRKIRILFLTLVATLCLRLETFRRIVGSIQCAGPSWEPMVPFVLAMLDYWVVERHRNAIIANEIAPSTPITLYSRITTSPLRNVIAVLAISVASVAALRSTGEPRSTYVCAGTLPQISLTPVLQLFGTALDVVVFYCISQLLTLEEGRGPRSVALRFMTTAYSMIFTAGILAFGGAVWYVADSDFRQGAFKLPYAYGWSLVKMDTTICVGVAAALICISQFGAVTTTATILVTAVTAKTSVAAWHGVPGFPVSNATSGLISISALVFAALIYLKLQIAQDGLSTVSEQRFRKLPGWIYMTTALILSIRVSLWWIHHSAVLFHPIDTLIQQAQAQHTLFRMQSASSSTLQGAQQNYLNRYKRHPPPGFDKWYTYASIHNSLIIDDYDSIHRDLLPFYGLEPKDIRELTWELVDNPWHDAAGIMIRNGKAEPMPNVVPTHRWMIDGVVGMINHFAEWLPDMDLAFNINDECRITVPYGKIQRLRQSATKSQNVATLPKTGFSNNRAASWKPVSDPPSSNRILTERSWQRIFYQYGSVGCPPGSPSRNQRLWDTSRFCASCARPQSIGAFLANWSAAADICHQPDLADMHGLYTSPAAFKGSYELLPIFSQSKSFGFNDILYPSAWNYMDKAKYDPSAEHPDESFAQKNTTLFWRGATSEGVSFGRGLWRGMARQRFIHLANNPNNSAPAQPLLLPRRGSARRSSEAEYAYENVPSAELVSLLPTNVHVVDSIARCGGRDCNDQAREFAPLVPPMDFQEHWRYKYLLDMDGAGFSGRFLPFLQSRSLPFKSALFREWWDDRVTAWEHFVPLDLRGHGFWATLAYFAGLDGTVNGRHVRLEAHEQHAERIAEQGRLWANRALRKEDMEIYFFRLLLEWGRLTDDNRDNIGFHI